MTNYLTFEDLIKNLNSNANEQAQIEQVCTYILALKAEPIYKTETGQLIDRKFNKSRYHMIKDALSLDTKIKIFLSISQKSYNVFNPEILQGGFLQYFVNIKEKALDEFTNEEFKACFAHLPKITEPLFQSIYTRYLKNPGLKKEVGRALLERALETKSFGEGVMFDNNINKIMSMTVVEVNSKYKLGLVFSLLKEVGIDFEKYPLFLFKHKPLKKDILKQVLEQEFHYMLEKEAQMNGLFLDYFKQNNVEQCKVFLEFFTAPMIKSILSNLEGFSEKKIFHNNGYTLIEPMNPLQKEKATLITYMESLYLSKVIEDNPQDNSNSKKMKL
jgi:hypothetical protein